MQTFKYYLSFIAIIIINLLFLQCGTAQKEVIQMTTNPPFKILEATHQDWVAGVQGGGAGTTVMITFSDIDRDVEILNFYFGNFKALANVLPNKTLAYQANILNNINDDRSMNIDPKKEINKLPHPKSQFNVAPGNAIIEYRFNGNVNFYKVTKMIEKPLLAYPSANPNENRGGL
ncbi:hypothetical protein ULMS_03180 [Patiriisocius marinistellae]|uniref:Uncharacterized protein n=1 Tax=Patiriisocius marinistellae TaxID=2494560 RepID=A0A5J4FTB3_9FLAO|nr:hypothetical protein [Patiriisocius marinistellae]GEQ84810.1 hypothetical protein ULMS_03180 [Patiriisocius marinistellae]